MCTAVDPISAGLTVLSTVVGIQSQQAQARAQADYYNQVAQQNEANAQIAEQNARIVGRQKEAMANQYADQQKALRDRLKLVKGSQTVAAGASGLDSSSGSALDILSASYGAYGEDENALRTNQRYDMYAKDIDIYNLKNQASDLRFQAGASRSAASSAIAAGNINSFSTLLSGATTYYGLPKKIKAKKGVGG